MCRTVRSHCSSVFCGCYPGLGDSKCCIESNWTFFTWQQVQLPRISENIISILNIVTKISISSFAPLISVMMQVVMTGCWPELMDQFIRKTIRQGRNKQDINKGWSQRTSVDMIHASHLEVVEFMSGGVELQTAGWQLVTGLEVRAQVLVRQTG